MPTGAPQASADATAGTATQPATGTLDSGTFRAAYGAEYVALTGETTATGTWRAHTAPWRATPAEDAAQRTAHALTGSWGALPGVATPAAPTASATGATSTTGTTSTTNTVQAAGAATAATASAAPAAARNNGAADGVAPRRRRRHALDDSAPIPVATTGSPRRGRHALPDDEHETPGTSASAAGGAVSSPAPRAVSQEAALAADFAPAHPAEITRDIPPVEEHLLTAPVTPDMLRAPRGAGEAAVASTAAPVTRAAAPSAKPSRVATQGASRLSSAHHDSPASSTSATSPTPPPATPGAAAGVGGRDPQADSAAFAAVTGQQPIPRAATAQRARHALEHTNPGATQAVDDTVYTSISAEAVAAAPPRRTPPPQAASHAVPHAAPAADSRGPEHREATRAAHSAHPHVRATTRPSAERTPGAAATRGASPVTTPGWNALREEARAARAEADARRARAQASEATAADAAAHPSPAETHAAAGPAGAARTRTSAAAGAVAGDSAAAPAGPPRFVGGTTQPRSSAPAGADAPPTIAPAGRRSTPRIHTAPTPTRMQTRAQARRHPHPGHMDSWFALWAVPTGEENSLLRPSRQRMMRRWLAALILAALLATAGVLLLVFALMEGQDDYTPIGAALTVGAAVVALLAEALLRPSKGAC
ncbi:hypothetical protein C1Y63_08960 [Corynebacterium sp. 13CS0277]|nr:hypothetical protein C1Y63_08960 [Corynebacterium sp. 13CS0277]